MTGYEVEHILAVGCELGESPVWHSTQGRLYWVDIDSQQMHTYDPASGGHAITQFDRAISCLAFTGDGRMVMGTADGLAIWQHGQLDVLTDNPAYQPEKRFNDGTVDRAGRLWAGTLSDTPTNNLYRMDADGTIRVMQSGLTIANGIGFSPDDRLMYHVDSGPGTIYVYDFDLASGAISGRRVFFQSDDSHGTPDGLTVDREGFIWCAFWDGWKLARLTPDGHIVQEVRLPVQRPTSCTFGGPGLDTLYITSAATGIDRDAQPLAGDLFRFKPDVGGFAEPLMRLTI
ncbi:MAG: SMP-30/gluconolactonase/LRE family protein [Chloroflexota bacterium]